MRKFQQFIDGKLEDGMVTFENLDPATGSVFLGQSPERFTTCNFKHLSVIGAGD